MMVLSDLSVSLDPAAVKRRLHIREPGRAETLVAEALALARPRAVYRVSEVERREAEAVVIGGKSFRSKVLRRNLDAVGRVFPAVVTLGERLEAAADRQADLLDKYYLDAVGNLLLAEARRRLIEHLGRRFGLEKISWMSPGSLSDWPLSEQRPLFDLLAGAETEIGVRLTASLLMLPRKSVSGIFFPSEATFLSCRLCPRARCEGRKARYDAKLAREYGVE
jgi:hypothetical protein